MNSVQIEKFHSGHSLDCYNIFGAHEAFEGVNGVRFTVWAPNAIRIQVIGSFNNWDGNDYEMEKITAKGIWSLFVPNLELKYSYKFRIKTQDLQFIDKADPFAFYSEVRPSNASLMYDINSYQWQDDTWLAKRSKNYDKPLNIYEFHAGSWQQNEDGSFLTYQQMKQQLIPYLLKNGFTHVEFMPLSEHPYDGSWGYQTSGYFACTSRFGKPDDFKSLVDECHKHQIGVIMDMVPVHFVSDDFGLKYFDGGPVYEYKNRNDAFSEWGTMNFDLWKEEVRSFLMSSAAFWCQYYHIDGIRFDAVSHLIHWSGNSERGENEGALTFIRRLNYYLGLKYPKVMLIAEDSSDFPNVTKATKENGLGFDYKWDLGWMNDTLKYYQRDFGLRQYYHNEINFSMAYFYYEKFLLPLSHDEVVHGKKTIVDKMFGDYQQKFAQVKNLYCYMFTHPGKKLNFMGNELAMFREWDENKPLDWFLLKYPIHDAFNRYFRDISLIYQSTKALYQRDYLADGFKWIDADNNKESVYSYYREDEQYCYVVVLNMMPTSYEHFKIGVPFLGEYLELINTEKDIYAGCNMCNYEPIKATKLTTNNLPYTLDLRLAPFAGIIFKVLKQQQKKREKNV